MSRRSWIRPPSPVMSPRRESARRSARDPEGCPTSRAGARALRSSRVGLAAGRPGRGQCRAARWRDEGLGRSSLDGRRIGRRLVAVHADRLNRAETPNGSLNPPIVSRNQGTDLIGTGAPSLDADDEVTSDRRREVDPEAPRAQFVCCGKSVGCVREDGADGMRPVMRSHSAMHRAVRLDPNHLAGALVHVTLRRIELRRPGYPSSSPRCRASRIRAPSGSPASLVSSQPW